MNSQQSRNLITERGCGNLSTNQSRAGELIALSLRILHHARYDFNLVLFNEIKY